MWKLKATTALLSVLFTTPVLAEPAVGLGITFGFGGGQGVQTGVSARVFSDDRAEKVVGVAGATYYFEEQKFGFDLGLGYTLRGDGALGLTYDFLNKSPQFSLSAVDIC